MKNYKVKRKDVILRCLTFFTILALCVGMMHPVLNKAMAEETASIKVKFYFPDAEFKLYQIGSKGSDGSYDLTGVYASYNINLNSADAASTLAEYVKRDGITEYASATTDEKGYASFTDLPRGVYLLTGGDPVEYAGEYYQASSVLLALPSVTKTGDENWNLTTENKYEKVKYKTELTVRKVWKSDNEEERPESVTVQLLCDGEVAELEDTEVTLNGDNNWTYTWKKLSKNHIWSTVEKSVPEDYIVSNSTDDEEIVITNTAETPYTPDSSGNSGGSGGSGSTLPHTGQYWLPVLGLVTAGLFLILLGLLRRIRKS